MSEEQADYVTDAMEMIGMNEPKEIIQTVSGFVPVFDVLIKQYGDPLTALVFGRRWQYCRMSDGVCRASLETIAEDLQVSSATVMRHTEKLVEDGYLIDTTPERRNRPHVYADAGKIVMKSHLTAGISQRNVTVSQRNAGVSESQLIKQDNTKNKNESENTTKKGDLMDGVLFFEKQAKERGIDKVEQLLHEMERGLHVNIPRTTKNQAAAKRILNDGRPFAQWLTWCISEEWRAAHLYLYAEVDKIWREYPQAFENTQKDERPLPPPVPERVGVPNPFKKPENIK